MLFLESGVVYNGFVVCVVHSNTHATLLGVSLIGNCVVIKLTLMSMTFSLV